jgi:hypothetical protein
MVTLDNTMPEVTAVSPDPMDATISAMVSEASTVTADVTALNAAAPTRAECSCTDAFPDGRR